MCFPASRGPFSFVFAELTGGTKSSARQLSEYKGKGASTSREGMCRRKVNVLNIFQFLPLTWSNY